MLAHRINPRLRYTVPILAALMLVVLLVVAPIAVRNASAADSDHGYVQTNLVSDLSGVAATTDPHLVNAWGITFGPTTPFWISDNGTGFSTLYNGAGTRFPPASPLVVTIPPDAGSPADTTAAPTGTVFNGTTDFVVAAKGHSAASRFIFATEDGTISGWNPAVDGMHAILGADRSADGAVYKGLALAQTAAGNFLYATNFRAGTVDVFDAQFHLVSLAGAFVDPNIPAGYAPFNVRNIGGWLYVTYAKQNDVKHDDVAGQGHGFLDVFDTSGQLVRRIAQHGVLNSPWGLALAPASFGRFGGDLLVGNFGDGHINAFDPASGNFRGELRDDHGHALVIDGLWALTFGNGASGGRTDTLYFTAGPDGEQHGLFGAVSPAN